MTRQDLIEQITRRATGNPLYLKDLIVNYVYQLDPEALQDEIHSMSLALERDTMAVVTALRRRKA